MYFSKRKEEYIGWPKELTQFPDRILDHFSVNGFPDGGKFLDVGTGSGKYLEYLLVKGFNAEMYGVDICKEILVAGKRRYKSPKHLILADAKHLPFLNGSFFCVANYNLFHHLVGSSISRCRKNVALALKEIARVLWSEGVVFTDEQCLKYKIQSMLVFWLSFIFAKINISFPYLGIGERVVVSFLTTKELRHLITSVGLKPIEMDTQKRKIKTRFKLTLIMKEIVDTSLMSVKRRRRASRKGTNELT